MMGLRGAVLKSKHLGSVHGLGASTLQALVTSGTHPELCDGQTFTFPLLPAFSACACLPPATLQSCNPATLPPCNT